MKDSIVPVLTKVVGRRKAQLRIMPEGSTGRPTGGAHAMGKAGLGGDAVRVRQKRHPRQVQEVANVCYLRASKRSKETGGIV